MTDNVNTSTNQDEDFYDDATEAFPSVDDLAPLADKRNPNTDGRLVAIWAKENGTAKSDSGDGTYGYTETITLVLDDGPEADQFTELVPAVADNGPVRLDLRHSTTGIHSRLKPRVDGMTKPKKDADGNVIVPAVPMKFRPMLGRVNTRQSTKIKSGSPAFSISAPSEEDKAVINRFREDIVAINRELEAKAKTAADAEAFDE
jgi:hypothetical protein